MTNIQQILRDPQLVETGVAQRRHYQTGESIIVEGSEERSVYLIETGSVRVSGRITLQDNRHIQPGLCDLATGEIFGELSLFESGPRTASVVAIEPCDLLVFDGEALARHFDAAPEQGYQVLKWLFSVLNLRLRQADRRLGFLFAWGLKAHGIDRHL
ncbi:MAG: cyclic nucleotide-binding domain-containing protein [Chromatiaceae bacterium]|nr:cyclic nucleotide-binding domain-containing protein [Chromatiaceae bacterium]